MIDDKLTEEQIKAIRKVGFSLFEKMNKPWRRGREHITEKEQWELREKNKEFNNKRRFECEGIQEDRSDKCDFYDPYPRHCVCTKYDKQQVECITYCTWRTIKGTRINDSMNPLHMERIPRWNEFLNEHGEMECRHIGFYNEEGREPP